MLINVPQYIDVEDKIVGPLTAKQLGWMIALGVILVLMWNMLPKPLFFILGIPLFIIFIALAFYKPYGQPLGSFVVFGIMYFFRPKIYFWKRPQQRAYSVPQKTVQKNETKPVENQKQLTSESIKGLAELLDSRGTQYNEEVMKIIKQPQQRK